MTIQSDRSNAYLLVPVPEAAPLPPFVRDLRSKTEGRGELRLALAVLEDALDCLERHKDSREFLARLFRWEALQWVESRDRLPVFSFENVCFLLDIDPEKTRRSVERWLRRRPDGFSLIARSRFSRSHAPARPPRQGLTVSWMRQSQSA
ncbi:MAG TPA: hypothetical protein VGR67_14035 [Candidatus Polarisedimenticolia bacterium]|jgi:hypothetical protein|nr:hypothetical protein [Candidatus Polarisedimenticolia bacterium]